MTENRRIFVNILATYGRSLLALVCGLFTSRWVLMSLGQVDYGLYGLIGSLAGFIAFLNNTLAMTVGRFYAYSIGEHKVATDKKKSLNECRRWFTVALITHFTLATALILIGYPLGCYAIREWLTIPAERVEACIWVFRFSCISCFIGMMNVPFSAMFYAKQYIAEITIYSVFGTCLTFILQFIMVSYPRDWLVLYSFFVCVIIVLPNILILLRALKIFEECKVQKMFLFDLKSIKKIITFTGWTLVGNLGNLIKTNGMAVLVNKKFGAAENATMAIANNASMHTVTLASALQNAFMPALTSAVGTGNRDAIIRLLHRTCKFSSLLVLIFAGPLILEINEVLLLWLKNPPPFTGNLCCIILLVLVLDKMTSGHWVTLMAYGKIKVYFIGVFVTSFLCIPSSLLFIALGGTLNSVVFGLLTSMITLTIWRVIMLYLSVKISPNYWIKHIFIPILISTLLALLSAHISQLYFDASFLRILLTTFVYEVVFLPLVWILVLDKGEKTFVVNKIKNKLFKK